jgi:hypothetical protein
MNNSTSKTNEDKIAPKEVAGEMRAPRPAAIQGSR